MRSGVTSTFDYISMVYFHPLLVVRSRSVGIMEGRGGIGYGILQWGFFLIMLCLCYFFDKSWLNEIYVSNKQLMPEVIAIFWYVFCPFK
jgi:hypothetical protein